MMKKVSGMDRLARVETTNLNQKVYNQLRQSIMTGKFRPGQPLTLRGLAAALGTSVMPARDAVLRLAVERALEPSGRGVRIPVLDMQRLEDILRIRISLEGEACAMAAERATADEIRKIEAANERAEKTVRGTQFEKFLAANQEFHFTIYRAAHNELLQSMIETLWLQIGPHLALVVEEGHERGFGDVSLSAHKRLIAAIRRRDAAGARDALRMDLKDSTDIFKPLFPKAPASNAAKVRAAD